MLNHAGYDNRARYDLPGPLSRRLSRPPPLRYATRMPADDRTQRAKRIAANLGFDRVGIAPPGPPPHADFLDTWLARGFAGQMRYLHRYRDLRLDPRRLLPGARSVICVAMNYHQPDPPESDGASEEPHGRFARYAWGGDYHVLIRQRLDALVERLREAIDETFDVRPFVDTAPVLERPLAATAGLGWIGKNTMLIVPRMGSFVFLGGVVTTLELDTDEPVPDRCGRCRRCIEACPTGALATPYVMDASRCLSYLTIELRDAIPAEFRDALDGRIFGCDACQRACPHNRRAPETTEPGLRVRFPAPRVPLLTVLGWSPEAYAQATGGRAVGRATLSMLRRNAVIALGNLGDRRHQPILEAIVAQGDSELADHARWALRCIASRR